MFSKPWAKGLGFAGIVLGAGPGCRAHAGGRKDSGADTVRVSAAQRDQALSQASAAVTDAADEIRRVAGCNPWAVQALAQASAATLMAMASTVEGRRGGALTEAAEWFDKAARAGYAKVARGTTRSNELRAMARLLRLMGHISGDEDASGVEWERRG